MANIAGLDILGPQDLKDDYGKWLLHGPHGAGKTTLASTIARAGKTLFIDFIGEKGVRSFQGAPWAKNIDVIRPKSITELDDLYWALEKGGHGYKAVVIDSLTAAQKMTSRFVLGHSETAVKEIKMGTAPASFQTWGQSLDIMVDLATFWFGLADGDRDEPMHVVMTSQTKMVEDEVSQTTMRIPDVQKGALSIVPAAPDYVAYCDVEDYFDEETEEERVRHIVRFGKHVGYMTKGRIPVNLRGKMPSILGRGTQTPDLVNLSRVLGIGGIPAAKKKAPAQDKPAGTNNSQKD